MCFLSLSALISLKQPRFIFRRRMNVSKLVYFLSQPPHPPTTTSFVKRQGYIPAKSGCATCSSTHMAIVMSLKNNTGSLPLAKHRNLPAEITSQRKQCEEIFTISTGEQQLCVLCSTLKPVNVHRFRLYSKLENVMICIYTSAIQHKDHTLLLQPTSLILYVSFPHKYL